MNRVVQHRCLRHTLSHVEGEPQQLFLEHKTELHHLEKPEIRTMFARAHTLQLVGQRAGREKFKRVSLGTIVTVQEQQCRSIKGGQVRDDDSRG